jgi:L,D-transpeptidase-like protein
MPKAMLTRPALSLAVLALLGAAFALTQTGFTTAASEPLPLRAAEVLTAPEEAAPAATAATASEDSAPAQPQPASTVPGAAARSARADRPRPLHLVARAPGGVQLHDRPGGPARDALGATTEFGSPTVLGVAARRGRWLGVVTTARPNGKLAWVDRRDVEVARIGYSLHADLSGRWVELRRKGRRIKRLKVAVGQPGSATPTGRFAITDKLSGGRFGPYYGCCILALSGHQPNTPPGWTGDNRLAIHGTDSPGTIGAAASAGCLRAADSDLGLLMRRVPLGTPVFIRA